MCTKRQTDDYIPNVCYELAENFSTPFNVNVIKSITKTIRVYETYLQGPTLKTPSWKATPKIFFCPEKYLKHQTLIWSLSVVL